MNAGHPPPNRPDMEPDAQLAALLRSVEAPPTLPPWFVAQLLHRARWEQRPKPANDGWTTLLTWLLQPRHAFAGLALAVLLGAGLGFHHGSQVTLHFAEIRYLDAIDPVLPHP